MVQLARDQRLENPFPRRSRRTVHRRRSRKAADGGQAGERRDQEREVEATGKVARVVLALLLWGESRASRIQGIWGLGADLTCSGVRPSSP